VGKPIVMGVAALALTGLALAFGHYNDTYSAKLPTASGWVRVDSRQFEDNLGAMAGTVRDWVGRVGEFGMEVTLSTKTASPLVRFSLEEFVDEGLTRLREQRKFQIRECSPFKNEDAQWRCFDLSMRKQQVEGRQRTYVTRRGNTFVAVMFTAVPAERFSAFGNPEWWIGRLEWHGPAIAYSY